MPGWKDIVGTVAPALATALGGPLAGLGVAAIGKALGLGDGAGEEDVAAAMLKAMAGLDKETRKALDCAVGVLFIKSGAQSLLDDWKRESAKRRRKKAQRKEKEEP